MSFNRKLSQVVQEISKKTCENERRITKSDLALLHISPEQALHKLLGFGYTGIIREAFKK